MVTRGFEELERILIPNSSHWTRDSFRKIFEDRQKTFVTSRRLNASRLPPYRGRGYQSSSVILSSISSSPLPPTLRQIPPICRRNGIILASWRASSTSNLSLPLSQSSVSSRYLTREDKRRRTWFILSLVSRVSARRTTRVHGRGAGDLRSDKLDTKNRGF